MKITLYTHGLSPFGMKVYWSLIYKGLDFDLVYVTPRKLPEIAFTKQGVVPVVKIDSEWKLDSTPIVRWLDDLSPDLNMTGNSEAERRAIEEVDDWSTNRLIPAAFRHLTNGDSRWQTILTGMKFAWTMRKTTQGKFPPLIYFPVYASMVRRTDFIIRNTQLVSDFKILEELNTVLVEDIESFLSSGPFIGGLDRPTLADMVVYAQVYCSNSLELKGCPDYLGSDRILKWAKRLEQARPRAQGQPILYPGAPPNVAIRDQHDRS